jgi:hypothetical protein
VPKWVTTDHRISLPNSTKQQSLKKVVILCSTSISLPVDLATICEADKRSLAVTRPEFAAAHQRVLKIPKGEYLRHGKNEAGKSKTTSENEDGLQDM